MACLSFTATATLSQTDATTAQIYLHGQTYTTTARNKSLALNWPQNQCTGGRCYAIVQFEKLPAKAEQASLLAAGLKLHHFIPNFAFLASVPEGQRPPQYAGIRAVVSLAPAYKRNGAPLGTSSRLADGRFSVQVLPMPEVSPASLAEWLERQGFGIVKVGADRVEVWATDQSLPQLLSSPAVLYVENSEPAPQKEGGAGRSSARMNRINTGPGLGWDGTGVVIGIGDDGAIHHQDFRGRYDDHTGQNGGNHAEMTAGFALGAGNIDPLGIGMAPGAGLELFDIGGYPHLNDAPQWLSDHGMVITSTSYAEGCGGYYSLSAQQLDNQVLSYPELLHCFSAGNEGLSSCDNPYSLTESADGFFWGNITGGRKAGKNHLTVGNIWHTDVLRETSSRGPTTDGRIKPDLCAMGQGSVTPDDYDHYQISAGTSAASPQVAGLAAALYQYYRSTHAGANPPSALVKAALLNTAEDLGAPGPDYSYGWGRIHAGRALEVLETQRYMSGTIEDELARFHQLIIPAGVSKVKVMLYWHDPGASPLASRALVNDLDIRITSPIGQVYYPWAPSHAMFTDSLQAPAFVQADRLNNAEQIVLQQPNAGYYSIRVHGFQVPQGPQTYYIVYTFEYDNLSLSFPTAETDALIAGEAVQIRWDALPKPNETYTLSYSLDGMNQWQTIATGVPGTSLCYTWTPPLGTASGEVFIRISRGSQTDYSDEAFVVSGLPELNVSRSGDSAGQLSWTSVAGAQAYEILMLGDRYMEVKDTVVGLSWTFPTMFNKDYWLSVRPLFAGNKPGQRSIAKRYYHEGCPLYVNLSLNLGSQPGQLSWRIVRANGSIFTSGGPYPQEAAHSSLTTSICLPAGCYGLILSSTGPGGVSDASFQLNQMTGQLIASAPSVGPSSMYLFCASMPGPVLQVSQVLSGNESCAGRRDGWISLSTTGGSTPPAFQWSHGATGSHLTGLAAGTYSVTITDGQQIVTRTITLTAPPMMSVGIQSSPDYCQNGSLQLSPQGGVAPYSYLWSDGATTATRQGLAAGGYGATLTDAMGCSLSVAAFVTAGPRMQLTLDVLAPSCADAPDGVISAQLSQGLPPYQYQWSTGEDLSSIDNLAAGVYRLSVTDGRACTLVAEANLEAPSPLELSLQLTATGAQAVALGGTAPYQYTWSHGGIGADQPNLMPGTYSCTLTDAHGCSRSAQLNLTGGAPVNYCAATGTSQLEWIQQVRVNSQIWASGNNGGYTFMHDAAPFVLRSGSAQQVGLTAGFAQQAYGERWRVYIDYNRDGDFGDSGELVVSAYATSGHMTANFTPPLTAVPGYTRMRVMMRYGSMPQACGNFSRGEVEDYWVVVEPPLGLSMAPDVDGEAAGSSAVLYPNPVSGQEVNLRLGAVGQAGICRVQLLGAQGQLIRQWEQELEPGQGQELPLSLGSLPAGLYWVQYSIGEQQERLRLVCVSR